MYEAQGTLTCPPTPRHPNPKTKSNTQKRSKTHVRFSCRRQIHGMVNCFDSTPWFSVTPWRSSQNVARESVFHQARVLWTPPESAKPSCLKTLEPYPSLSKDLHFFHVFVRLFFQVDIIIFHLKIMENPYTWHFRGIMHRVHLSQEEAVDVQQSAPGPGPGLDQRAGSRYMCTA